MKNFFNCEMIDSLESLLKWRAELRYQNQKLVVASGCFDLLHSGHCAYLKDASKYGDYFLVGLNNDASVRALKGNSRPINNQKDRANVISCLRFVDAVYIYENTAEFLKEVKPDIWVKGADYNLQTLNQQELSYVRQGGGDVVFSPLIAGLSTTSILSKI